MENNDKIIMFHQSEASLKNEVQSISEQKGQLLAKKIELGMKEKQFNRQQFAGIMGVQPSIVTRWLSGNHNFTVETLFEIENKLGIQIIAIDRPIYKKMNFHMVVGSEAIQHIESSLVEPWSHNMHSYVTYCTKIVNPEDFDDLPFVELLNLQTK